MTTSGVFTVFVEDSSVCSDDALWNSVFVPCSRRVILQLSLVRELTLRHQLPILGLAPWSNHGDRDTGRCRYHPLGAFVTYCSCDRKYKNHALRLPDSRSSCCSLAMTGVTDAHRALITDALVEPKPFHAEGIWTFPRDQLNLFLATEPWCALQSTRHYFPG